MIPSSYDEFMYWRSGIFHNLTKIDTDENKAIYSIYSMAKDIATSRYGLVI